MLREKTKFGALMFANVLCVRHISCFHRKFLGEPVEKTIRKKIKDKKLNKVFLQWKNELTVLEPPYPKLTVELSTTSGTIGVAAG